MTKIYYSEQGDKKSGKIKSDIARLDPPTGARTPPWGGEYMGQRKPDLKKYQIKKYPTIGVCGLDCGLCPNQTG